MPGGIAEPPPMEPAAPPPSEPATAGEPAPPAGAPEAVTEAESHPPNPPETPAEMAQSLAKIAEQVAGARPEGDAIREALTRADANPIARLARRTQTGPITVPPRMKPMRPARRGSHLGLVLIAGLLIGLLVAAYVFRDVIMRAVPGAEVIYAVFGLSADSPIADLEISIDTAKVNTDEKTGRKIFDVTATVFNLSADPVTVPPLMVVPVDGSGSPLEPMEFRLRESVIEPGQNIKFRKSFEDWPSAAPNFELRWAQAG
jgi:hypothetical protein